MTTKRTSKLPAAGWSMAAAGAKAEQEILGDAPVTLPASVPAAGPETPPPSPGSGPAALRRIGAAVELLPPDAPREDWLAARRSGVTASEIAVVLGISPFDSPFNLFWQKLGLLDGGPDDDRLSLGRHMEPWIADRWEIDHPEYELTRLGLLASADRPWQMATPDRGLVPSCRCGLHRAGEAALAGKAPCCDPYDCGPCCDVCPTCPSIATPPTSLLELKTSGAYDGWGPDGTDEVPAYYRAQLLWQLDVLGLDEGVIVCFFLHTQQTRSYTIAYDADDVMFMRTRAEEFLARVEQEDPPPVDGHHATTAALRALHPDVDDDAETEVPADVAEQYRQACDAYREADAAKRLTENTLRAHLGDARTALDQAGRKLCSRSVYDRKGYWVGPATIDRLTPAKRK
ncbi:YqaJ viral recombinase family protein [Nocardiopsis gilva]|uniref:YqaJ viral recombinase family nuclease n=1 Tax=Nocardiopsis gilva TaxID=280236 RepID=UPI00034BD11D|nr:YqaJ viral recombinase family protein [Nocardiopsis gilva]